jgi:hypothetical protein
MSEIKLRGEKGGIGKVMGDGYQNPNKPASRAKYPFKSLKKLFLHNTPHNRKTENLGQQRRGSRTFERPAVCAVRNYVSN